MLPGTHLLIDGKNLVYRAVFAKTQDSPVEVFFRILLSSVRKSNATDYHLFWDCPREEVWRKRILPSYKATRPQSEPEIGELIGKTISILKSLAPFLKLKQYNAKTLEADDLIYTFCTIFHPTDIVVLSSDTDLLQLPFRFLNTRILKPAGDFVEKPIYNPIIAKCLSGDKSDNIIGYNGIGPVKSQKLAKNVVELAKFVTASPRTFYFNLNLVDLAMAPAPQQMLAQNKIITGYNQEVMFDMAKARGILCQHNMYPELHNLDWSAFHENKK